MTFNLLPCNCSWLIYADYLEEQGNLTLSTAYRYGFYSIESDDAKAIDSMEGSGGGNGSGDGCNGLIFSSNGHCYGDGNGSGSGSGDGSGYGDGYGEGKG